MEKFPKDLQEESIEMESDALTVNLNTLIEMFQLDERDGKYDEYADIVNAVERTIQMHTTRAERGYNRISNGKDFLADLHESRERLLSEARDDDEKVKIKEIFARVDIR